MEAEAELSMRLGLAKAEKALQGAAKRETAMSERHAVECERYESELRRAEARAVVSGASPDAPCLHHFGPSVLVRAACCLSRRPFVPFTRSVPSAFPYASSSSSLSPLPPPPPHQVLRREISPLEIEIETHAGVYTVLQRTLAHLAESENRARAEREAAEISAARLRDAQRALEEERAEAETARSEALSSREAKDRAEASASAAARRAEREVAAAESAKSAAVASADSIVRETHSGAAALSEAVAALHRWVDGVMVHGASNAASTLEAVQAIVKGGAAQSPTLRGAHASLEALHTRLQYVMDEVIRLRQTIASRADEITRKAAEISQLHESLLEARQRGDRMESASAQSEEEVRQAVAERDAAAARAEASEEKAKAAEAKAEEVRSSLALSGSSQRQLASAVAVQLSDAMRRSGCVASDAPMLLDSSCSGWEWEKIALHLSHLASHVSFYWAADQRNLADVKAQLDLARERIAEREQNLNRAAAIASGLKRQAAGLGGGSARGHPGGAVPHVGRSAPSHVQPCQRHAVSMRSAGQSMSLAEILAPLGQPVDMKKDLIAYDAASAYVDVVAGADAAAADAPATAAA